MDLKSDRLEVQSVALQLAEASKSKQVLASLLELLKNSSDFDLKKGSLHTLSAIANPDVLPELDQLLKSSSFLHPKQLQNLKLDIIRSLERYPTLPASQLLAKIPEIGNRELTTLAEEIARKIQARHK